MVSHETAIRVLAGSGVSSEGSTQEGSISRLLCLLTEVSSLRVGGLSASIPCHVGFSSMAVGFIKVCTLRRR